MYKHKKWTMPKKCKPNVGSRHEWLDNTMIRVPDSLKCDDWENNPSFSAEAYREHFGFSHTPGYMEVNYND